MPSKSRHGLAYTPQGRPRRVKIAPKISKSQGRRFYRLRERRVSQGHRGVTILHATRVFDHVFRPCKTVKPRAVCEACHAKAQGLIVRMAASDAIKAAGLLPNNWRNTFRFRPLDHRDLKTPLHQIAQSYFHDYPDRIIHHTAVADAFGREVQTVFARHGLEPSAAETFVRVFFLHAKSLNQIKNRMSLSYAPDLA